LKLLLEPPSSLTPQQRALLWITLLFVIATRVYALSRTLWDWDEVQFAAGVREFNVGHPFHHPHPPGFPLYMLAAKIVRPFVESDFIACQTIVFLSACALFPLAFFVARELRFPFATSYSAALLFVFLPNVWFFGGTAFSDIPGVAASLAAAMLLLRGCRSPRAYLGGAIVLGVAAGIRPQALLLGCAPFLAASWFQLRQSWLRVIGACAIVAAIVSASYIGAALASNSIAAYRVELLVVRNWVRGVDSFLSPQRPPLRELADDYFVRAVTGGRRLPYIISALAAFGLLAGFFRSRISVWLAVATFIPFTLFAYLMLDYNSVHRYSTAYVFLWALLAAHGTGVLFAPLRGLGAFAQVIFVALLAARAVQWTIPALREVQRPRRRRTRRCSGFARTSRRGGRCGCMARSSRLPSTFSSIATRISSMTSRRCRASESARATSMSPRDCCRRRKQCSCGRGIGCGRSRATGTSRLRSFACRTCGVSVRDGTARRAMAARSGSGWGRAARRCCRRFADPRVSR